MMTKAQFRRLLDAHGADASRLPAALRDEAEAYLATDPAAAGVLRDAERLDRLIAGATAGSDPHRLRASAERVMAALGGALPPQRRLLWSRLWPTELLDVDFAPAWARIGALAAVASLGFVIGLSDANLLVDRRADTTHASAPRPGMDLLSTVFEPDLLPGLRP